MPFTTPLQATSVGPVFGPWSTGPVESMHVIEQLWLQAQEYVPLVQDPTLDCPHGFPIRGFVLNVHIWLTLSQKTTAHESVSVAFAGHISVVFSDLVHPPDPSHASIPLHRFPSSQSELGSVSDAAYRQYPVALHDLHTPRHGLLQHTACGAQNPDVHW